MLGSRKFFFYSQARSKIRFRAEARNSANLWLDSQLYGAALAFPEIREAYEVSCFCFVAMEN